MQTETQAESAVKGRYSAAAQMQEAELCCPIDYDPKYLEAIPNEVIDRDYGCGDPSRHLQRGETVLDLGSGTGKICFIASQVVGPEGRVIGIDMTPEMLDVARRNAPLVADRIGHDNVEFRRGRIQDLTLDLDVLEQELKSRPVSTADDFIALDEVTSELRRTQPLVADESIDVVVSNCVLNLVASDLKRNLFREIHRVLRRGGRAVISDIVADEAVPEAMQRDSELWSGCISGALTESDFMAAFEQAGFYGIRILERQEAPWRTVEGIEFRSMTIEAFKGKEGPCLERLQSVIYRGPFKVVVDDDGHRMERGKCYAVCDKTFQLYRQEPYRVHFEHIEPPDLVPVEEAGEFDCTGTFVRDPKAIKGSGLNRPADMQACCTTDSCC